MLIGLVDINFVSGVNLLFFISISLIGIISILYIVLYIPKFEYIKNRLLFLFDKETGTYNFQSDKALDSIMSGGFFGKGIGEGTLKNRSPRLIQIILFLLFLRNLVL